MTGSALEFLEQAPPEPCLLRGNEIHVWRAWLDLPAPRIQRLQQTLAVEEQARTSQFRFATDRSRFIAARGILRAILGRYLHRHPHTLRFAYNEYGKPVLLEEAGENSITFNVTHAQHLALYAFTLQHEIGIDVEQITTQTRDYEGMARRFFSAAEVQELCAVPAELRQEAFLNGWTRKEAYIKARSLGLSLDLRLFDVALTPGKPAALLATREEGQEALCWSLYDLDPGPGYIAALAVEGHPTAIACWQWV